MTVPADSWQDMSRSTSNPPDVIGLVSPPYSSVRSSGDAPLGTIVIADARAGPVALDVLIRIYDSIPWCAICLVHASSVDGRILLHVAQRLWPSLIAIETDALAITANQAKVAVATYGAPSFEQIASYISQRLNRTGLKELLLESFNLGPRSGQGADNRSRRTLDRRMRTLGPMSVSDWRAVARIVQVLAKCPASPSIERLAWSAGLDPRTFRGHCHHFLGLAPRHAVSLVGWRWVVEATLLTKGYLPLRGHYNLYDAATRIGKAF